MIWKLYILSRVFSFKESSGFKLHLFEWKYLKFSEGNNRLFSDPEFSMNVTQEVFFHKLHFWMNNSWKEFEQLQLMLE